MKTFLNLMEEIITPRLCHRCGGCVAFCTAINFGALEMDNDGRPHYKDQNKCIECGLCYEICPAIEDLRDETRKRIAWTPPIGRVIETTVARARNPALRSYARDGGVFTSILLHLFDIGRIDGAVVNKVTAPFICRPWVARKRQEIIEGGGMHFDASPGVSLFGEQYASYPPYLQLITPLAKHGMRRIAFVGRPCQIETMRRMETLGLVPSEVIKYYFGLFCMGNFRFGEAEQAALEQIGGFKWEDVRKVNFKEGLQVHLKNGDIKIISFADLDFMKRYACRYCSDFSAEFADISVGGLGAMEGWSTVILRSPVGRAVFTDAGEEKLEILSRLKNQEVILGALNKVRTMSDKKKQMAEMKRKEHTENLKLEK
jgi:coenzyme F420 hydrogenase subunit beta